MTLPQLVTLALGALAGLVWVLTTSEPAEGYERRSWGGWVDTDGDGLDTRHEVLAEESLVEPVLSPDGKRVVRGVWVCPYTGVKTTDPADLDVDHLIPLAYASRHGAKSWTRSHKEKFANDLSHPEHLVAVQRVANRQKGAKGPSRWMPPKNRCWYAQMWASEAVRHRQLDGLVIGFQDWRAIGRALQECTRNAEPE